MDANHFTSLIMRSEEDNLLFASPVQNPKQILDIGTGSGMFSDDSRVFLRNMLTPCLCVGAWAMDVADKYPDATVHGIDLFPPPHNWVPPNCVLEVEDVSKEWTWRQKFDLIHMYVKFVETPGGWVDNTLTIQ